MASRIYVMTHKKTIAPTESAYCLLQVGRARGENLGYTGDDTGDNISVKNNRYGELTGVYWIWKNSDFTGNVGVCHYRRFFIDGEGKLLKEEDYDRLLEKYDIIVSKAMETELPYRDYYNEAHDPRELKLLREAMEALFPEDLPVFDETMEEKLYYFGNLCVMRRPEFDAYAAWLFALMGYVEERIDLTGYDEYRGRVYGFLSEQLLRTWTKKRDLRVYECSVGISGEKAETVEFKLAMKQLVKMGQITEANQMFNEILKVRPDLNQESADLKGELPIIQKLLYIASYEKEHGISGLLDFSDDLTEWITHYKRVTEIVKKRGMTEEDRRYLKKTHVSDAMKRVIELNETDN